MRKIIIFLSLFYFLNAQSLFVKQIKQSLDKELQLEEKRLDEFKKDVSSRKTKLTNAKNTLEKLNQETLILKEEITKNNQALEQKEQELKGLLGDFANTTTYIKQTSNYFLSSLKNSFTIVQFPQIKNNLLQVTNTSFNKEELESFWLNMLEAIIQSGNISSFQTNIISQNGEKIDAKVTRIGNFSAFYKDNFLHFENDLNSLVELKYKLNYFEKENLAEFENQDAKKVNVTLDVTKGEVLMMLENEPNLIDRIKQGGIIGYIIIVLGIFGLIYSIIKLISLNIIYSKIKKQLKNMDKILNNPLGKIIKVFIQQKDNDIKTIEIKITEEILTQSNKINQGNDLIKLLATITPLLGLLGTVTGMITTFQAITLFGTSDPKLMAEGISSALITTVLGLISAISLLFIHASLNSKANKITSILEEQSVGLIAKSFSHD